MSPKKRRKYAVRHQMLVERSMYPGICRPVGTGYILRPYGTLKDVVGNIFTNIQSLTGLTRSEAMQLPTNEGICDWYANNCNMGVVNAINT